MTADEIRDEFKRNALEFNKGTSSAELLMLLLYGMAGEIAAQLAELNHHLREGNYSVEVFGAVGEP